jgi:hypothetical protein
MNNYRKVLTTILYNLLISIIGITIIILGFIIEPILWSILQSGIKSSYYFKETNFIKLIHDTLDKIYLISILGLITSLVANKVHLLIKKIIISSILMILSLFIIDLLYFIIVQESLEFFYPINQFIFSIINDIVGGIIGGSFLALLLHIIDKNKLEK